MARETVAGAQSEVATNQLRNARRIECLNERLAGDTNSPGIGPDFVFRDPWGSPYIITLDLNGDGKSDDCLYHIKGAVSVWSFGPDRKASATKPTDADVNKDNIQLAR